MTWPGIGAVLVSAALSVGACSRGADSACTEVREPADLRTFGHVIDPDSVSFDTSAPTSGPHMAVPAPSGVLDAPIEPALQVRLLESGRVLIQWEGIGDPTRAALEALTGPDVVVAPGVDLPGPIVATAWTWRLTCDELDVDALTEFAGHRTIAAPGAD